MGGVADKAILWFDKTLMFDAEHKDALYGKGTNAFLNEKLTIFVLGAAMLMLGDPTKALTWFDRALGIDGNHIESLHGKGIAFLNLGDPDVANEWFDKVLAVQPTHPGTYTM